jgi:hypothetical protein
MPLDAPVTSASGRELTEEVVGFVVTAASWAGFGVRDGMASGRSRTPVLVGYASLLAAIATAPGALVTADNLQTGLLGDRR